MKLLVALIFVFEYIFLLLNQKLDRFSDFFGQTNFIELLFGSLKFADAGGDTSYLNFLACHGIIGIYILLIVCKDNINRIIHIAAFYTGCE